MTRRAAIAKRTSHSRYGGETMSDAIGRAGNWRVQLRRGRLRASSRFVGRSDLSEVVLVADQRPRASRRPSETVLVDCGAGRHELVVALRGLPVGHRAALADAGRDTRGRRPDRADSPRLRPRRRSPRGHLAARSSIGVPSGRRRRPPRRGRGGSRIRPRRGVQRRHSPRRAARTRVAPGRRRRSGGGRQRRSRRGSPRAIGWGTSASTSTTPTRSCTRPTRSTTRRTSRTPSGTPRRTSSRTSRSKPGVA